MQAVLKLLLLTGALLSGMVAVNAWQRHSLADFCESLTPGMDVAAIRRVAMQRGFEFFHQAASAAILNHRAPFFRHTCVLTLADEKVLRARTMAAD